MPFELTILGSSSALPTSERYPTAQVLNASGQLFLIDCGEGTQIQIRRHKISFGKINHIFISHLHGDHYYGLIGMISTLNLLGLKKDVHIYSPSQLKDIIQPQLDFLKGERQFKIIFHPLDFKKPREIFKDKKVKIISFPLKHSIQTCGFLFKEVQKEANIKKECIEKYQIPIKNIREIKKGAGFTTFAGKTIPHSELTTPPPAPKSFAFCSDTAFHPPIADIIRDVDLLYHEATFTEALKDWAKNTFHSTAMEAAEIARLSNAGKLILGHFSARYKDTAPLLEEARSVFPNTEAAEDGKTYAV